MPREADWSREDAPSAPLLHWPSLRKARAKRNTRSINSLSGGPSLGKIYDGVDEIGEETGSNFVRSGRCARTKSGRALAERVNDTTTTHPSRLTSNASANDRKSRAKSLGQPWKMRRGATSIPITKPHASARCTAQHLHPPHARALRGKVSRGSFCCSNCCADSLDLAPDG